MDIFLSDQKNKQKTAKQAFPQGTRRDPVSTKNNAPRLSTGSYSKCTLTPQGATSVHRRRQNEKTAQLGPVQACPLPYSSSPLCPHECYEASALKTHARCDPLGVEQPFHRGPHQIPCVADIYVAMCNQSKIIEMSSDENDFNVGISTA